MTARARLHVVTDDDVLGRSGWLSAATAVLEAGASEVALHIRGRRSSAASLFGVCRDLGPTAAATGAVLIVNDRVDVAVAADAHGVHLGGRSLPAEAVRPLLRPSMSIGISCHTISDLEAAHSEGADYAFFGSVFATPTHPEAPGLGLGDFERAVSAVPELPVFAIGGVRPDDAAGLVAAGAAGVAAIRGVWNAEDPAEAVLGYISALATFDVADRATGSGQGKEPPAKRA